MNRVRHLAHALIGLVLIAAVGALLAQKSVVDGMRHHSGEKAAVAGLIIVLALIVLASLAKALLGGKPDAKRPGLPYAAAAKRR
jgi:hypothetical protein